MAGETETPNIGLQIPGFNQPNWQVPLNYDLNLLDLIFGGGLQVPGLSVETLTVANFVISNLVASLANSFVQEAPTGAIPGTVYTLSHIPGLMVAVFYNGALQIPGTGAGANYTMSGNQITFNFTTDAESTVYALYFH